MKDGHKPDTTPWDQKTPEQRAQCVTDHLAHEFASGNIRPIADTTRKAQQDEAARLAAVDREQSA